MKKVLGIDIDGRSIRMALIANGRKTKLLKTVQIPIPFGCIDEEGYLIGSELDMTLEEVIKRNKLNTKFVAICIRNARVRPFSFSNLKERDIKNALELDLSASIKDISVSYQLQYRIYKRAKKQISGLVAFAPHSAVELALSYQEKLPGTIKYLDVYPNAIVKAIQYTAKKSKVGKTYMIIDIGYKNSNITIAKDNEIQLSRMVNSGAYHLDLLITEEFKKEMTVVESERKCYYKNFFEQGIDIEQYVRVAYQPVQIEALQAKNFAEQNDLVIDSVLLIGEGAEVPSIDLYIQECFDQKVLMLGATDVNGKFVEGYHKMLPAIGAGIRED